jgi:hypothetical protein
MADGDRYGRQRRLAEMGDAGQARLSASVMEVAGSDGAILEAEYLHRAGVQRMSLIPGKEPAPFRHEHFFKHPAARRVAAGAWRALTKIRRELGLDDG